MQTEHINSTPEAETNLKPLTLNFKPRRPRRHSRCRNGKIARLPRAVREAVNLMLLDGFHYREVIAKLEKTGYRGISLQNLSGWFKGGYQDWLRRQDELQDLEQDRKALVALAKDPVACQNLAEASETLLTIRLYRTLKEREAQTLPEFLKVAELVNRQSRERNRRARLALEHRRHTDSLTPSHAHSNLIKPNPTQ
jgi:hypothetical protein